MTRKKQKSLPTPPKDFDASIASGSGQPRPTQTWFKCPCDGENNDCVHCNGSGRTTRLVEMRSRRTLSLDHPSPEQFRSKQEKIFDLQVNRELPYLREKFLNGLDEGPELFVQFLEKIISKLDSSILIEYISSNLFINRKLENFIELAKSFNRNNEDIRIFIKTTNATIAIYEKSLIEKRIMTGSLQPASPVNIPSGNCLIQCPYCGSKIYNQDQHNQLFHPSLRKKAASPKKTKQMKQFLALPPSQPAQRAKNRSNNTANKTSRTQTSTPTQEQRKLVDTSSVERSMDAHRKWGGRFRDTNGTFGSYPLHDNMDDESDAG